VPCSSSSCALAILHAKSRSTRPPVRLISRIVSTPHVPQYWYTRNCSIMEQLASSGTVRQMSS
jgi:hypothetical protein